MFLKLPHLQFDTPDAAGDGGGYDIEVVNTGFAFILHGRHKVTPDDGGEVGLNRLRPESPGQEESHHQEPAHDPDHAPAPKARHADEF